MSSWGNEVVSLAENETKSLWKPFPDHYINTRKPKKLSIPQISPNDPLIQVFCKISDNFSSLYQYAYDEDSVPPKVFCWSDVSHFDQRTSSRIIQASLEKEYNHFLEDFNIFFQKVSSGNSDPLPFEVKQEELTLFHIFDPIIVSKSRLKPSNHSLSMKTSRSSSFLNDPSKVNTIVEESTTSIPIHEDLESLERICQQITNDSVIILDCNQPKRAFEVITKNITNVVVFGATSEKLVYSPQMPFDLFTSCLLTPAQISILWQSQYYTDIKSGSLTDIDLQAFINILNDSPVIPSVIQILETCLEACISQLVYHELESNSSLFYSCFRKHPILKKLFINFLLASRIMRSYSMVPFSYPELPDFSTHIIWTAYDLHVDQVLYSIHETTKPSPRTVLSLGRILEEQLKMLQNWLLFPKKDRQIPEEIQYIAPLLSTYELFDPTIKFCAQLLKISNKSVVTFLSTNAFSAIIKVFSDESFLHNISNSMASDLSSIILNCFIVSPLFSKYFEKYISFWLTRVKTDDEELQLYSLACIIVFSGVKGYIEMYKSNGLVEYLQVLVLSTNSYIRVLSHVLLSKLGSPISFDPLRIEQESSPLVRAALLSRQIPTIEALKQISNDVCFEIISNCNDMDATVREETIIALNHILGKMDNKFLSDIFSFVNMISNLAYDPLVPLIGNVISVLSYDPSPIIKDRLKELIGYITKRVSGSNPVFIESNFSEVCLNKIAKEEFIGAEPVAFSERIMVSNNVLVGKPDISPSGYLICSDQDGHLLCQTSSNPSKCAKEFKFFDFDSLGFQGLESFIRMRKNQKPKLVYNKFMDDNRIFSCTDRSQVSIIDIDTPIDPVASFILGSPDTTREVFIDLNTRSYSILHTSNHNQIGIFSLDTMKRTSLISIPAQKIYKSEWFKPYSTLFYTAQDDLNIFDSRMPMIITSLRSVGKNMIGCNISGASPFDIIAGYSSGNISLIDIRTMTEDACYNWGSPIQQFEVHKHLPYGIGLSDSLVSFSSDNGIINPKRIGLSVVPSSFSLHPNENACSIRIGSKIGVITQF